MRSWFGAIALTLAACAAPEASAPTAAMPPSAPPPPAVASPAPPLLPAGVDVSYTLELVREPFPFVGVTFITRGSPRGETRVALDDWAGLEQVEREVHGLVVTDEDGHPLAVERVAGGGHGPAWTVHHPPGAILRARYALVSTQSEVGDDSSSYYRALVQPSFFHTIGATSLLYVRPDSRDTKGDPVLHHEFHWRGFTEAGWKVASSFSVERDFTATETSDHFRHAVFLAGDLHLVRRDIGPTKSPLWIAIAGSADSAWGFTDDAFADTAASIVQAQRGFFADYDWPYFLISMIPVGKYHPGSYSRGGTGLTQSFALFLSPKSELGSEEDGAGVRWLLSHELFHLWNGNRYELTEPEALGYWFSEGFTDFYARRLLFRSKLAGAAPFVANLNDQVLRYTLSPVRKEPATRIAADFWKDRAVEKLPYQRGDVVALVVDAEIRKVSKGGKSLDDLMKELLAVRKEPTPEVTPETFLALIGRYTSAPFADRIRKVVVDGAPLDVDPKLLEPCLHGHVEQVGPYEPGFDVKVARAKHEVAGVVPGSAAYKAGLRNGQRFASFGLDDNPRHPMDVSIWEGKEKRAIHYVPQGKPVPVVQFKADEPLSAACGGML